MVVNSVPDVPDDILDAYYEWDVGGDLSDYVTAAGGADKAKHFENLIKAHLRAAAARAATKTDSTDATTDGDSGNQKRDSLYEPVKQASTQPALYLLALIMLIGFAIIMEKRGQFRLLGILLIAVSWTCHLVALLWLEILTMPKFRNRPDFSWSWKRWMVLLATSAAASSALLTSNYWVANDTPWLEPNGYWHILNEGYSFSDSLETFLIIQIFVNVMLIWSVATVKIPSRKLIRSPWTVASIASLICSYLVVDYPELGYTKDLFLMVFAAAILGSAAWIYGRAITSDLLTRLTHLIMPAWIGYMIIEMESDYFPEAFGAENPEFYMLIAFVAAPLILNATIWIMLGQSDDISNSGPNISESRVNWKNIGIFSLVIICISLVSTESETIVIPLIPLAFSYLVFSREHSNKMGGDILSVHKIIERDSGESRAYKRVGLKFSLLGAHQAGKTSFTTALWTLLTTSNIRNIWWSDSVDSIGEHQILTKDEEQRKALQALAERGRCKDVDEMMQERICAETCKRWIAEEKFPIPGVDSPFPFSVEAYGISEKELNGFKKLLTDPDERGLPAPTNVAGKITMVVTFHADVETISPSFLGLRLRNNSNNTDNTDNTEPTVVELTIETWDIQGESFTAGINWTREIINVPGSRKEEWMSREASQIELNNLGHSQAAVGQVNLVRDIFLQNSHSFLVVDLENLLEKEDSKGVEKYLRLLQRINREGNSNLESIQILLNKADDLLDDTSSEVTLTDWHEMNDQTLAERTLNQATNHALDDLKGTGLDAGVRFVCAFGGLIPELNDDGEQVMKTNPEGVDEPSLLSGYPMVPVNVLEPIIDVILTSNRLHSEEL